MSISALIGGMAASAIIADANQFQIQRWPGKSISVYDQSGFRPSLEVAILQWDNSGIGTRFILTDDPQADVVVRVDQRACRGACGGMTAYLGYNQSGMETISLPQEPSFMERHKATYYMTRVLVHELGHVLGLQHRDDCSVMSGSFMKDCGLNNSHRSERDIKECGPLPVDVVEAKKLYGQVKWPVLPTGCQEELN